MPEIDNQQRAESDAEDHGGPEGAQGEPGDERQQQNDERGDDAGDEDGAHSQSSGTVLTRDSEPVAAAAHRLDEAVLSERLERLAQAPDVDVDRALLDIDVVAPHVVQQLRARMHALRTREQEAQQPEFGGAERNRCCRQR